MKGLKWTLIIGAFIFLIISSGCFEFENGKLTIDMTFLQDFNSPQRKCKNNVMDEMKNAASISPVKIASMKVEKTEKFTSMSEAIKFAERYPILLSVPDRIEKKASREKEFYVSIGSFEFENPLNLYGIANIEKDFSVFVCDSEGNLL